MDSIFLFCSEEIIAKELQKKFFSIYFGKDDTKNKIIQTIASFFANQSMEEKSISLKVEAQLNTLKKELPFQEHVWKSIRDNLSLQLKNSKNLKKLNADN